MAMRNLLKTSAFVELGAGIAALALPTLLATILLGGSLDPTGLAVTRLAGVALLSLAVACWRAVPDAQSRAARGVVAAMLLYNVGVATLFAALRFGLGMHGIALLPAAALHAALAVWCVSCLRRTLSPPGISE
jgi:hypothetical protein